jgi:biotin carboxyl carrier protein
VNFDVAVNGRAWKVGIEAQPDSSVIAVSVKGKTRLLNASWIDADTLSLIEGSSAREVRFHAGRDGVLSVAIDGKHFQAVVSSKKGRGQSSDPIAPKVAPDSFSGSHAIKAPMPGRVVRVLVAVGDRVNARQGVAIVEAMKMENELRSAKDGVVKEVNVLQGAAIEAGTVLVVIE